MRAIGWSVGSLVSWLFGWLVNCLVAFWLFGCLVYWPVGWLVRGFARCYFGESNLSDEQMHQSINFCKIWAQKKATKTKK